MKINYCASVASCLLLALALPAHAERADRDKPVHLEADRMSIDDIKKIQTLEGRVVLIQGTIEIRTNHLVVTQDADGFQKGTATSGANGLARFRQKREGRDEYIEGEAERIEYDARSEKAEFFNRAWVRSGLDEVRGQYISYDGLNESYLATTGGAAKNAGGASQARVRAIIQPKSKGKADAAPAAQKGPPLILKPAANVAPRSD
ncbi:MAG TPA: lipopolysaccharide transport periplasmic protein LptA [Accumulibacter sp.]|uniref:lipopolysaccharide transport periplasmic protein LptA n=1 Tax=Accumulibacter sp. TaxID=2053492 RepID=UPI002BF68AAE|nr:lipopolysaccharide transport periplasmic protein LptA [Accumulibacter sp.]HMV04222.1 lipopolysaccharide transport periplasmic protein LptA [Accumulibacter sp.]HMW79574.1 lipopolysaccharide transport periplasmic protein LptA [Accumulibacter sp.]HMX67686.1 lipopolysaccharide transport periplasmic protein LptA [Accumulibacter sp.]HNB66981.1 lipopolysaccharide transport periplasmic protein LptA [Accumulibacter sp.]HNH91176.1 lipopolysaccharide transport periplasmic protein LptA [Accumulibacter 